MSTIAPTEVTALLIEDNPGDATLIETYLSKADTSLLGSDITLRHEESLEDGLEQLTAEPVDVLLLDLGLPESEGLETLETILEVDIEIPIVVLTGLDDQSTAIEAIQQGAQDYLTKDRLDGPLLVRTIRYAIERTETRRELERQNERLDQFASVISHDLRNPLNVARGRMDLVQQEYDNEFLDEIEQMHERMEQLIEDVLTLARQGQTIGEVQAVKVDPIAAEAWKTARTEAATLRIESGFEIKSDPERLQTLLENLFKNAVRHVGPEVMVTVGPIPENEGFYVSDDGPGIPEDTRDAVFEPGYTTAQNGSGFGLNIVKDIAEAHGWEISLTDNTPSGARFEFIE